MAILIGLPVLYVARFGPACWLQYRDMLHRDTISILYRPGIRLAADNHESTRSNLILWRAGLAADGYLAFVISDREDSIVGEANKPTSPFI